jgi:hypothetical protein
LHLLHLSHLPPRGSRPIANTGPGGPRAIARARSALDASTYPAAVTGRGYHVIAAVSIQGF